jgi:hypothetical protein
MKVEKNDIGAVFDYTSKYNDDSQMREVFPEIETILKGKLEQSSQKIFSFL